MMIKRDPKLSPKSAGWYWVQFYHNEFGHTLEPMYFNDEERTFNGISGTFEIEDQRLYEYSENEIDYPDMYGMIRL